MTVADVEELLPEADRDFLAAAGYDYTIDRVGEQIHVVIRNFPLPLYKPQSADLLIIVPNGYPNAKLDMFWTFPDVSLPTGGIPLRADVHEQYGGRNWQRWSRHIADGAWRPGVDNLRSYMTTVKTELAKGL
ncbi:E2/UBC family protein [Bradyrhizobium guangxiense]